jgi:hypothetical protein
MIEAAMEGARRSTTDKAASARRLDAVREILRALETATVGGQQHLMMKVLELLRREALGRERLLTALDALAVEAGRLAPDPEAFRVQAAEVADALDAR